MKPLTPSLALLLLLLLGCGGAGGVGNSSVPIPPIADNVSRSLAGAPFCCDAGGPFPQDIATLTVANNYADRDIVVVIGPFTNGVVTEDGALTQKTLKPGDVLDTRLQATRCDWETAEGNVVITTVITSSDGPDATPTAFSQRVVLQNGCPSGALTLLTTRLEISGLARANFRTDDPPVVGTDPLLYVTGPSNNLGVEAYAIQTDPTTGLITGTPRVDEIQIFVPPIPATGPGDDVVLVSAGAGPLPGVGKLTRALYPWGFTGFARSHFVVGGTLGDDWGGLRIYGAVKDLISFGGDSRSTGVSYISGVFAAFQEYDPSVNFFNVPSPTGALGGQTHFPDHKGDPVSVFVDDASGGAIIVMDSSEGNNGQIWFHDRVDTSNEASLIGTAGDDPRQVRAKNGLAAISNYASHTLTLLTWGGPFAPLPAGTATPGPTALPNPLKLDMLALDNGNTAVAVGSDTTDRWWIGEFNGATLVNQWEGAFGRSGGLADVVFLPGSPTYLAIAIKGFRVVQLVETTLTSPPQ